MAHPGSIELALQADVQATEVGPLAAEAERMGFARFLVPDHPGSSEDPFVALAAAASCTSTIGLGTYVLNAGVRDPWQVATAAATLDDLSRGRFNLGVGAGHTPSGAIVVQHLELTDDPESAARLFIEEVPELDLQTALDTPFVHFRTVDAIGESMRRWHRRLGITSWVVRPSAMRAAAKIAKSA